MEQVEHAYDGPELMAGERIGRSISSTSMNGRTSNRHESSLVLTNTRIILVSGSGDGAKVVMASLDDVDAVEITSINEGYGAFIWAGLSVILSIVLYGIIGNEAAKIIVPVLVLAMGGYLVVNRLFLTGGPAAIFRTGASEITWSFRSDNESQQVREFIIDLYRLKTDQDASASRTFAPR